MANRVRNIVLCIPVTAQEREMIELKMQQMGTSTSPPMRYTYSEKLPIASSTEQPVEMLTITECAQEIRGLNEFTIRLLLFCVIWSFLVALADKQRTSFIRRTCNKGTGR